MPRLVDVEARRAEITDAAARVIARSGIDAATMREVAAEAGWTTGAVTHYFADKHELLVHTFQQSLAHRRSLRPQDDDAPASVRLRAALEGALPIDEDRRRHWLVTLACCTHAASDPDAATVQREAYREFREHVTAQVRDAGMATTARDARRVAERLIAASNGIAIQALFDPDSWPAHRQQALLDELLG